MRGYTTKPDDSICTSHTVYRGVLLSRFQMSHVPGIHDDFSLHGIAGALDSRPVSWWIFTPRCAWSHVFIVCLLLMNVNDWMVYGSSRDCHREDWLILNAKFCRVWFVQDKIVEPLKTYIPILYNIGEKKRTTKQNKQRGEKGIRSLRIAYNSSDDVEPLTFSGKKIPTRTPSTI